MDDCKFSIVTPERKDGFNRSVKKLPCMKEWMAKADPQKEASTVKKMNDRLLLLLSNKMTICFKESTTARNVLKKNPLSLQKLDASNRTS